MGFARKVEHCIDVNNVLQFPESQYNCRRPLSACRFQWFDVLKLKPAFMSVTSLESTKRFRCCNDDCWNRAWRCARRSKNEVAPFTQLPTTCARKPLCNFPYTNKIQFQNV